MLLSSSWRRCSHAAASPSTAHLLRRCLLVQAVLRPERQASIATLCAECDGRRVLFSSDPGRHQVNPKGFARRTFMEAGPSRTGCTKSNRRRRKALFLDLQQVWPELEIENKNSEFEPAVGLPVTPSAFLFLKALGQRTVRVRALTFRHLPFEALNMEKTLSLREVPQCPSRSVRRRCCRSKVRGGTKVSLGVCSRRLPLHCPS